MDSSNRGVEVCVRNNWFYLTAFLFCIYYSGFQMQKPVGWAQVRLRTRFPDKNKQNEDLQYLCGTALFLASLRNALNLKEVNALYIRASAFPLTF